MGEWKFFLAVNATNKMSVQKAKVEIMWSLKEGFLRLQVFGILKIQMKILGLSDDKSTRQEIRAETITKLKAWGFLLP